MSCGAEGTANTIDNTMDKTKTIDKTNTKWRTVELRLDDHPTGRFAVAVDGVNDAHTSTGTQVVLSYQLPTRINAMTNTSTSLRHMTVYVYQKTGTATVDRLVNAERLGMARALDIGDRMIDSNPGLGAMKQAQLDLPSKSKYQY
jgi:hypothetical protein